MLPPGLPLDSSMSTALELTRSKSPRKYLRVLIGFAAVIVGFIWLIAVWQISFANSNYLVVYFGRPSDVPRYVYDHWNYLLFASLDCFLTAIISLILAWAIATLMLTIGLLKDGWLKPMEWFAATSQVVPLLVIVTVFFILERTIFGSPSFSHATAVYSLAPVTLSLIFPPLVYGANSIMRTQIQIKSLLRLWQAPIWWRIFRVYLPKALPDILTGLRTSATWAIGATLISEGLFDGVEVNKRTFGHLLVRPFSSSTPLGQTLTVIILSTVLAFGVYYLFGGIQLFVERRLLGTVVRAENDYSLQDRMRS